MTVSNNILVRISFLLFVLPSPCVRVVMAQYIPPWDKEELRPVLRECRLHEPNSSPAAVSNGEFENYATEKFQLINNQLTMFQTGQGRRNELRHNPYFSVMDNQRMTARVKIPTPQPVNASDESFSIFQSHVKDFLTYEQGPLLMVRYFTVKYGIADHLWVNLREDLLPDGQGKQNTFYDIGQRPTDFFDFAIIYQDGFLNVTIDNVTVFGPREMSYFSAITTNYFKAGVYMTGWESRAEVIIDKLTMGPSPDVDMPTASPTVSMLPSTQPSSMPSPQCDEICGDFICQKGETCESCPNDCNGQLGGKPSNRYCCYGGSEMPNNFQYTSIAKDCSDPQCRRDSRDCLVESCNDGPNPPGEPSAFPSSSPSVTTSCLGVGATCKKSDECCAGQSCQKALRGQKTCQ